MSKFYLSCAQVGAWPSKEDGKEGYGLMASNGSVSWCPKDFFERHYLEMKDSVDGNSITEAMVDDFISDVTATRMGNHTVVKVTLINGFTLIEESACVSEKNYNEELGKKYALEKAKSKIWFLLGFLLATAKNGILLKKGV